jgi:cell wall-associated NlpC family hydrolase
VASHATRPRLRPAHPGRTARRPRTAHAHPRTAPRSRRPRLTAVAVAVAAAGAVLLTGATAHAEPSPAEYEQMIDVAWNRLEPVIEQHNAARIQLQQNKAKQAVLMRRIQPLQLQIDLAMAKVGEMAARAYMGANTSVFNALLTSGSPTKLADQLSFLDQVARTQRAQISNVTDLKAKYEAQKRPLDALVTQLAKTEAALAAQEKAINTEIKRLQALRLRAYGAAGGLGELRPAPCPVTYPGGAAGIAVKYACAQIGKPYVWGADGPDSYDCSGLTMAAWAKAGVYLPHNAAAQKREIPSVSRANLRPGDLVFYYSDVHHVGMYVGGSWIVHASMAGVPIKMRDIDAAPIVGYGRPG